MMIGVAMAMSDVTEDTIPAGPPAPADFVTPLKQEIDVQGDEQRWGYWGGRPYGGWGRPWGYGHGRPWWY
jgi:hypothetical protein